MRQTADPHFNRYRAGVRQAFAPFGYPDPPQEGRTGYVRLGGRLVRIQMGGVSTPLYGYYWMAVRKGPGRLLGVYWAVGGTGIEIDCLRWTLRTSVAGVPRVTVPLQHLDISRGFVRDFARQCNSLHEALRIWSEV